MCRSDQSFPHYSLCGLRIPSQFIEFFFGRITLNYLELTLDVVLHHIFEFRLDLLRLTENISEF
jgi:hypothetical protein